MNPLFVIYVLGCAVCIGLFIYNGNHKHDEERWVIAELLVILLWPLVLAIILIALLFYYFQKGIKP